MKRLGIFLALILLVLAGGYYFFKAYTPTFYNDGSGTKFGGFARVPADLGKECANDDECEHQCLVDRDVMEAASCKPTCWEAADCPTVKGKCGNAREWGPHLEETGKVHLFCER